MPMSDDELAAIEARVTAATSAPWSIKVRHHDTLIYGGPPGGRIDLARIIPWMTHDEPNAAFIAAARDDVPKLLAEVRRLRKAFQAILGDGCERTLGYEQNCSRRCQYIAEEALL